MYYYLIPLDVDLLLHTFCTTRFFLQIQNLKQVQDRHKRQLHGAYSMYLYSPCLNSSHSCLMHVKCVTGLLQYRVYTPIYVYHSCTMSRGWRFNASTGPGPPNQLIDWSPPTPQTFIKPAEISRSFNFCTLWTAVNTSSRSTTMLSWDCVSGPANRNLWWTGAPCTLDVEGDYRVRRVSAGKACPSSPGPWPTEALKHLASVSSVKPNTGKLKVRAAQNCLCCVCCLYIML